MDHAVILVTGATGYVGGRLVPLLLEQGYKVRASGRSLEKLRSRSWARHPNVELVEMDVFDLKSIRKACEGCLAAYYLIHSMNAEHTDFERADELAAENFSQAAEQVGLSRIIYLGGLVNQAHGLSSKHLQSREAVGKILKKAATPVTEFRAAMIIGSGSASFEMLRYLVDRLPIMITPKWVNMNTQPIAIRNVLTYLSDCLKVPETIGRTFDIGGPDVLSYQALMDTYAKVAGLKIHLVIPVPVFSPTLSAYWIHFITPIHASIARPLAEGLKNHTICTEHEIQSLIPQNLIACEEAIRLALKHTQAHTIETHWSDAGYLPAPEEAIAGDPNWSGGTFYVDQRSIDIKASPEDLWKTIVEIGGETGWYYGNFLWKIRGLMDLFFGGVGLRRGRKHPSKLSPGDALDFWRVLALNQPTCLKLLAEMKLPGKAYLEFDLVSVGQNVTRLTQTARFFPYGILGILYWYAVTPLHYFVFNGMLKGIAKASGYQAISQPEIVKTEPR